MAILGSLILRKKREKNIVKIWIFEFVLLIILTIQLPIKFIKYLIPHVIFACNLLLPV